MIRSFARRHGGFVLRAGISLLLALRVVGWGYYPVAKPGGQGLPSDPASFQIISLGTIEYRGADVENCVQAAQVTRFDRQPGAGRVNYAVAGEGGFRIGRDKTTVNYGLPPLQVFRLTSNGEVGSAESNLALPLAVSNDAFRNLDRKRLSASSWEANITLGLGSAFPKTFAVRFDVQPLSSASDADTVLIMIKSDMLSFRSLDEKKADIWIFGRYSGVLVYSPKTDVVRQSSAVFTAYKGEDQIRVEQVHYPVDAGGKRALYPLLDLNPDEGREEELKYTKPEGPLPFWGVQAVRVFDLVNTAVMTAAEGSTNPVGLFQAVGGIWRMVADSASWLASHVGSGAARDFLLSFKTMDDNFKKWWNELGTADPEGVLRKDLEHLITDGLLHAGLHVAPLGIAAEPIAYTFFFVSAMTAAFAMTHLIQAQFGMIRQGIEDFIAQPPQPKLEPRPEPKPEPRPEPKPEPKPEPPPIETQPQGGSGGGAPAGGGGGFDAMDVMLITLLGGVAVAGGLYLANALKTSGCKEGYLPCGDTKKCCPESADWYSPSRDGCYRLYDVVMYSINDAISCHPATMTFKR